MASSWEAYQKAADQQDMIGSDMSTATGCSSTASLFLGGIKPNSDSVLVADPKRTALKRTPLSSQSKSFVPGFRPDWHPKHNRKGHESQAVQVQWMPMMLAVVDKPQDYNEQAQEDIYLALAAKDVDPYSETLQDDVYLSELGEETKVRYLEATHRTSQLRGRLPWRNEERVVSRTPSPPSAVALLPDLALSAVSWFSSQLETIARAVDKKEDKSPPVKRTFIHFDTSECDYAPSESDDHSESMQGRRLTRSSSAPSVLLTDEFQTMLMQVVPMVPMPELHLRGECSPCAYFYHKQDGCRRGAECTFCHECPADEMKRRKKIKLKAMKTRKQMLMLEENVSRLSTQDQESEYSN